jgi:hypothetical protein
MKSGTESKACGPNLNDVVDEGQGRGKRERGSEQHDVSKLNDAITKFVEGILKGHQMGLHLHRVRYCVPRSLVQRQALAIRSEIIRQVSLSEHFRQACYLLQMRWDSLGQHFSRPFREDICLQEFVQEGFQSMRYLLPDGLA